MRIYINDSIVQVSCRFGDSYDFIKEYAADKIIKCSIYLFKPFVHLSVILIELLRVQNDLVEIFIHFYQVFIEIGVKYCFLDDLCLVIFELVGKIFFVAFYLKMNWFLNFNLLNILVGTEKM